MIVRRVVTRPGGGELDVPGRPVLPDQRVHDLRAGARDRPAEIELRTLIYRMEKHGLKPPPGARRER
jgi:hypothetical protein